MKSWRLPIVSLLLVLGLSLPGMALSPSTTLAAPAPPTVQVTGVDAHGLNQAALVTWKAVVPAGVAGQYQVIVYRKAGTGQRGVQDWVAVAAAVHYEKPLLAEVTGLANGVTYRFTVKPVVPPRLIAQESAPSREIIPGSAAPDTITDLTAVPGNGSAALSWTPPDGAIDHYLIGVYRNGAMESYVDGISGAAWSYTVTGLINGATYTFDVRAIGMNGMMSLQAMKTTVPGPVNPILPAAPANLTASPGDGGVTLTWDAPTWTPTAIQRFAVFLYHGSTTVWSNRYVYGTSVTITGLANGVTYTAQVFAVSATGAISTPASLSFVAGPPPAPAAPTNVRASVGNGSVVLRWDAPGWTATAIDHYAVTIYQGSSAVWSNQSITGTTVTITGLTNGRPYTAEVRSVAVTSWTTITSGTVRIDFSPVAALPGAPRSLHAVAGSGQATVSWVVPADDGGSPILWYAVTYSPNPNDTAAIVDLRTAAGRAMGDGTTYSTPVHGLTAGKSYTFYVFAASAAGVSPASAASNAITIPDLPPTLQVPAVLTVEHDGAVTATVTAVNPEATDHLTLTASNLPKGLTFTDKGNGTGTLSGYAAVPVGKYDLTFSVSDGYNPPVTDTTSITVTHELAAVRLLSTAPLSIVLRQKTSTAARSITIGATIRELTESGSTIESNESADVTYTLTAVDTGKVYAGTVAVAGDIAEARTVKYTFRGIPIGVYALRISVGGSYYQGTAESFVAVSSPFIKGSVRGSGRIGLTDRLNLPGNHTLAQFSINVKQQASGKPSGSLTYVETRAGTTYTLTSSVITGLVVKGNRAWVQGKGILNGVPNQQFVATVVDNEGKPDRFGLRLIDSNFVAVNECTFAPVDLLSGSARVLHT